MTSTPPYDTDADIAANTTASPGDDADLPVPYTLTPKALAALAGDTR